MDNGKLKANELEGAKTITLEMIREQMKVKRPIVIGIALSKPANAKRQKLLEDEYDSTHVKKV